MLRIEQLFTAYWASHLLVKTLYLIVLRLLLFQLTAVCWANWDSAHTTNFFSITVIRRRQKCVVCVCVWYKEKKSAVLWVKKNGRRAKLANLMHTVRFLKNQVQVLFTFFQNKENCFRPIYLGGSDMWKMFWICCLKYCILQIFFDARYSSYNVWQLCSDEES